MYEQVLEETGRLNTQVNRQLSPPQDTTSENVEKMMRLDLFVQRFIDGSEKKTDASVSFFGIYEARPLLRVQIPECRNLQASFSKRTMGFDGTSKKDIGVTYHGMDWKRREAERGLTDWRYMERSQDELIRSNCTHSKSGGGMFYYIKLIGFFTTYRFLEGKDFGSLIFSTMPRTVVCI